MTLDQYLPEQKQQEKSTAVPYPLSVTCPHCGKQFILTTRLLKKISIREGLEYLHLRRRCYFCDNAIEILILFVAP